MKFVSVRDLRSKPADALRRARAVVSVMEIQRRSTELGTDAISPEGIDAEIKAVRRARRRADLGSIL